MSITGNLKTMELSEALQWLSNGAKTGTLVLNNAEHQKKIYFQQGKVIATASSAPREYLGHFLVGRGHIDELVLAQAMAMQAESKMLLGKILITIGAISEEALDEMLRLKAEETVYEIFTWEEGDFRFVDDELPDFALVPLKINLTGVVMEGVRRADEWHRMNKLVPSPDAVAVAVGELTAPEEDIVAAQILSEVNDDHTMEEIVLHSHTSEYHTFRVILDQVADGHIKLVRPRYLPINGSGPPGGESSEEGPGIEPADLVARAKSFLADGEFAAALRYFKAALSLTPSDKHLQEEAGRAEHQVHKELEAEGLITSAVPRLVLPLEELASVNLSPEEGFLLSRVNGSYDIETLIKISPLPPLQALLVIRDLTRAGHISLTG